MAALLAWFIKRRIKMALLKRLKAKLAPGMASATVGVAGTVVAVGVAMQASPAVENLVKAVIPDNYEGMALAALGLVVAIARFRTFGK